jgi:hypothetical protein
MSGSEVGIPADGRLAAMTSAIKQQSHALSYRRRSSEVQDRDIEGIESL